MRVVRGDMIGADHLTKYWAEHYGVPPVAHRLRVALAERWVRIHSLPDGKRYAEGEGEYRTLLDRHNELLDYLLSGGGEVLLVTAGHSFDATPVQDEVVAHPEAWHWTSVRVEAGDPDSSWCHLYGRALRWERGAVNAVVRLAADDGIGNVMVLGMDKGIVYHPYDGGADVILADRVERDAVRLRFSGWLSARADGL